MIMRRLRNVLILVAVSSVALLSATDLYARGGGRGGGRSGGGGGNQPAPPPKQPNPALVADRQAVTDTQKALETAKTAYNTKLAEMQKEARKAPEYVDAKKALEDAQKALEAARTTVIAKLKSDNADYKAAAKKESDAAKKLDTNRATATRDEIAALSKIKMDAGGAVEKLETKALEADQPYQDAKKAVADAKAAVDGLDAKIVETLGNDDTLKNLKQAMASAQTAYDAAKKKLEEDIKTMPATI
jgi:colicin import membrane protein